MSSSIHSDGGKSFFWLAAFVLGGLIFAAGVMVGRGMAPAPGEGSADPLGKMDARDSEPVLPKRGELTYPQALSGPQDAPAQNPDAGVNGGGLPSVALAKEGTDAGVPPASDSGKAHNYCLQIASFREQHQASQLVGQLKNKGLPEVRFVSGEVSGKGTYFRVRVGRFADRQAAELFDEQYGLEGLLIKAEN
jgi:cell division septation protein DedD